MTEPGQGPAPPASDAGVGAAQPTSLDADAAATPVVAPPVRILGVRHHGPGSARAVARALKDYRPTIVLIEGPADADALVRWVPGAGVTEAPADDTLVPPVALLAWAVDDPQRSGFWPLAVFSPEWQALTWASANAVEARFIDLPSSLSLADRPDAAADDSLTDHDEQLASQGDPRADHDGAEDEASEDALPDQRETRPDRRVRTDPIARLAELAGYDDPEAWWEDAIELRADGDAFDLVNEAMAELREASGEDDPETLTREAHMRQQLRAAKRAGHERIAVVCGAWHAPALSGKLPPASADAAALRGLPKVKTQVTWVPWTHSRLAFASGYGAGVRSPGWYHHLFTAPDRPVERWLTAVAGVLRAHDLPVSTAHVIESVRLADALGVLRGRPLPGLSEVTEATWSVMCDGNPVTLELVTREAVVGEALGSVPDGVGMVPLDADLRARARGLRLKLEASSKAVTLDLRKPNDLAKSQLLRQLRLLGIGWGTPDTASSTGTFKEVWTLAWQPEFAVGIVVAAAHGNTVPVAATHALLADLGTLALVTAGIETALLAGLDDALPVLLTTLDERAAHEADVTALLAAVPPLARVQRYGDVRRTDTAQLADVTRAILGRACAGLPAACSGLGDDAALAMRAAVDGVQSVIALVDEESQELWAATLSELAERRDVPGGIAGRVVRLLLDSARLDADAAARRLGRTLSPGSEPMVQAAWVEGFLAGSPLLVIHDDRLVSLLDEWLTGIGDQAFTDVLPILRRAFGAWTRPARRQLANRVAGLDGRSSARVDETEDFTGAEGVLATVALILGAKEASNG